MRKYLFIIAGLLVVLLCLVLSSKSTNSTEEITENAKALEIPPPQPETLVETPSVDLIGHESRMRKGIDSNSQNLVYNNNNTEDTAPFGGYGDNFAQF